MLFELAVTKAWLRQVIVALALIGRSAYRGVVEFRRDLLGVPVSVGCVHDVLEAATRQASAINQGQDLSGIRVGLHDERFQGATPVLAGVDAASTTQAHRLAGDARTLVHWLRHDVLVLAGPDLATRRELFDFIVAELAAREPEDPRRIRPVRVALQNQRDDLLAFTGVLDAKLTEVARAHAIAEPLVREACVLRRLPTISPAYWQGWNRLRAQVGGKFHALVAAVSRAMADTPRCSSLVENLNSRLRSYFTLRRHLGGAYLDLLRFLLNHRRVLRSAAL